MPYTEHEHRRALAGLERDMDRFQPLIDVIVSMASGQEVSVRGREVTAGVVCSTREPLDHRGLVQKVEREDGSGRNFLVTFDDGRTIFVRTDAGL